MRRIIILFTFFISTTLIAQVQTFEPTIYDYPDLNPDSLLKYETLRDDFNEITDKDIPYDSLTNAQKKVLDDFSFYEGGPYSTAEIGCSWYCATGPTSLNATSELDSNRTATYSPKNVHDFDLRTAWVEGKPDYGIGQEINIHFELLSNLKVTHVEIYNGYCKSEKAWIENSRVKKFALFANGKFLGNLNIADTYNLQRFDIGSLGGDTKGKLRLTFRILEVYKGSKYKDTAISEINFDGTVDH